MHSSCTRRTCVILALVPVLLVCFTPARAATDRWISSASGLWQTAGNWSSNTPPDPSFSLVLITNAGTKTVTINSTTPAANLSIQKLTVSAPSGSTNTLKLLDTGTSNPLQLVGTLALQGGGVLDVVNSAVSIDSSSGATLNMNGGTLHLESGLFDGPATMSSKIGSLNGNTALVNVNGGEMRFFEVQIGASNGAQGILAISNGVLNASSLVSLGQAYNSTGVVSVAGGQFLATNDLTKVGNLGTGRMDISGGQAHFAFLSMGENSGAGGTVNISGGELKVLPRSTNDLLRVGSMGLGQLNISGGTHLVGSELHLADDLNATGLVVVTGGKLIVTNDLTAIGRMGFGEMVVSNAFVQLTNASVGRHSGSIGNLVVQTNGLVTQIDDLSIGRFAGAVGHVVVDGGLLALTNDNVWIGREGDGDLTVNNGTVSAQAFFIGMSPDKTNTPTGALTLNGGTTVLSSNIVVGTPLVCTGQVAITGGKLVVTGQSGQGYVNVAAGTFSVAGGDVSVDDLVLTNASGGFTFNSGTVHLKQATVANGSPFVVGDGANPAILDLGGGTCSFANGLVVSPHATVTGCGTILGDIVNNGTIATNCGTAQTVTIATSSSPSTGGSTSGANTYTNGASVTVSATPNAGFAFVNWTESGSSVSSSPSYTFTATANRALVANFVQTFVIATSPSPADGGSTSGANTYTNGANVTVTATPNVGFAFVNWTENGTPVSPSASYTFIATANRTLVANFVKSSDITIAASAFPANGGSITGAGTYASGTMVTLTAKPNAGFTFVNWTEKGTSVSTSAGYAFTAITNRTLVANFAQSLTISATRNGNVMSLSFPSSAGVTYVLQYKDALTDATWISLLPGSPGTGGLMTLSDPAATTPTRFYRVWVQ